ncbi:MAG: large conductance mechanosensitive channel protein MscL [Candidatus Melainabacteria bacterium]|jgi:large conductance mechanosensitive channel|nr:large conductance mechanosensitive channel protein MscL [Candidatus Melainabacteria bacterium]
MGFIQEFKKFAMRGNLMDMAVGFTVGAAFSTIAKSLVDNVIMPPVGLAIGKADFSDFFILLKAGAKVAPPYATLEKAQAAGAVTLNYGLFVNSILAFLLVALAMFVIIRVFNKLDKSLEHSFLVEPVEEGKEPENKKCPFCISTVPFKAVRCAFCTSDLSDEQKILNESKVGQELVARAQAAQAEGKTDLHPRDKDITLAPEVVLAKADARKSA